jgi:hypothetical protein
MSKAIGLFLVMCGLTVATHGIRSNGDTSEPALEAETQPLPTFSTPVVVTITQRSSEPPAALPRAAPIPRDRDTLARELQKELKRVGCYEGELNGTWTLLTRRAMKAFTDRVNATLPVDEPDAILFTMVQGHQDKVCGKPCPSGQGLSEDGRCLPSAILAKAIKKGPASATVAQVPRSTPSPAEKAAPAIAGWSTVTAAAPAAAIAFERAVGSPLIEERMALAGPAPVAKVPMARRPLRPSSRAVTKQTNQGSSWARSMLAKRDWFN